MSLDSVWVSLSHGVLCSKMFKSQLQAPHQAWSLSSHIMVVVANHISLLPGTGATATWSCRSWQLWPFQKDGKGIRKPVELVELPAFLCIKATAARQTSEDCNFSPTVFACQWWSLEQACLDQGIIIIITMEKMRTSLWKFIISHAKCVWCMSLPEALKSLKSLKLHFKKRVLTISPKALNCLTIPG